MSYVMDIRHLGSNFSLYAAGKMIEGAEASHENVKPAKILITAAQSKKIFGTPGNQWRWYRGIPLEVE